jgi:transposase
VTAGAALRTIAGSSRRCCGWRALPEEFGHWNSVEKRFARWPKRGVWERVFSALAEDADFEEIVIDSTIVRVLQHAAGAQKKMARRRLAARAAG